MRRRGRTVGPYFQGGGALAALLRFLRVSERLGYVEASRGDSPAMMIPSCGDGILLTGPWSLDRPKFS